MYRISLGVKTLCVLLCVLCFLSFFGAFATWQYAQYPSLPQNDSVLPSINPFIWAPEEILPEDSAIGENYLFLTTSILENKKMGLNADTKDALEKAVKKEGVLHSFDNIQGGNLKHLFTTYESRALDFVFVYISDTEIHAYMYEDNAVAEGEVNATRVTVYKTVFLVESEEWVGKQASLGTAPICLVNNSNTRSVNYLEWKPLRP